MNHTVIIVHPDTTTTRDLANQVTVISEKLVVLESDSCQNIDLLASEYGCALLLIDATLCPPDLSFPYLPDETALLILMQENGAGNYLQNKSILLRNHTIISPSAKPALLQHHIQQLLKQQTTTHELLQARKKISELTKIILSNEQALLAQQRYMDVLSERDGLTGLFNRRHLTTILRQEFKRARRYETDLSLLLLDIDHFKNTNLNQGHLFGDFVLNELAARLTSNTRDSDLCFRFGGGNFVVLLPQVQIHHAQKVAEKLRRCCSDKTFDNGKNNEELTLSIGIASLRTSLPKTPEQLINMADRAMYQAKDGGKNRCRQYQNSDIEQ
ncbi:MAG: hypothetical protein DSY80_10080 [Desulfocapsa sp.]|nr:MAG: hypothetical protein DSY80_10080 [Desulfocapsa sp.]